MQTVAIGADHAGFELKEEIKDFLSRAGFDIQDYGCASKDSVDYPDYAKAVAMAVIDKKASSGILICNTGIGMTIAANKVKGVRAALVGDVFAARMSREHNDANILVLGAGTVDRSHVMDIVKAWFEAKFQGGRHARRVEKIEKMEEGL